MSKQINIRIPDKMADALDRLCDRLGFSMSEMIRHALAIYLLGAEVLNESDVDEVTRGC